MKLERVAQALIAASVVLSTVLFGIGQRSIVVAALMAAAAGVSLAWTDFYERWVLPRRAALLIAVLAAGVAITRGRADVHVQLVTLAILQAVLQAVLLFSKKSPRVNWQLLLLTLGQAIVASILNLGLTFGLALLPYFGVAILTLLVLGLVTDEQRTRAASGSAPLGMDDVRDARTRALQSARFAPPSIELMGVTAPRPPRFWRGILRQIMLTAVSTLAVTALFFFLLPRSDGENWEAGLAAPLRMIGFSPEVELGELGEALESRDVVMRVRLFDGQSGRPYALKGEPLFRGTALTQYDRGRWERRSFDDQNPSVVFPRADLPKAFVVQELTLEPLDDFTVFPVFPSFADVRDTRLQQYPRGGEMVRPDLNGQATTFRLATTAIRDHRLLDVVPTNEPVSPFEEALLQLPFGAQSELAAPLRPIQALAAQVLADAGINPANRMVAARRLSEYLRSTGGFQYSTAPLARDRALDPLVEFVTVSRRGHCEYFAGALALMLRSQGIPCRLAMGFKGGEWNALGGYYQVMQMHAHAWVEVYLSPESCAGQPLEEEIGRAGGGWLVLDPTAEVGDPSSWLRRGVLGGLLATGDFTQVLWSRYVVGLDMRRQHESIYRPLRTLAQGLAKSLVDKRQWRARLRGDWFDWKSGLIGAVGLAGLALVLRAVGRYARRLRPWLGRITAPASRARSPGFALYHRLETTFGQWGLHREPCQTPQEFCTTAIEALTASRELPADLLARCQELAQHVVLEFYRARYGHRPPEPAHLADLEQSWTELETAIPAVVGQVLRQNQG